ncbi:MAG: hypothetical protein CMI00_00460 [Oceanospirillaceae bacterium]|nr:hypothetical protein [Oceanospirillaceae bacterium]|tara:strand:- start:2139 stop:3002 length:864 start_codon:yes stop_codon:yes gene_type:complete
MKKLYLSMFAGLLMLSAQSQAADDLLSRADAQMKKVLGPEVVVTEAVSMAGGQLVELILNDGNTIHMTPDLGFFVYNKSVYQVTDDGFLNVSDMRMTGERAKAMAAIPDSKSVLFLAKGEEKARINVFTDIDCGYCQKLHQEVPQLNSMGITVRYLAYPRAGVTDPESGKLTDSYRKIDYVWCQDDRAAAMTAMKNSQRAMSQAYGAFRSAQGEEQKKAAMQQYSRLKEVMDEKIAEGEQCESPVADQFELGRSLGVTGTPSMITQDGALIPGYLPAEELAKRLNVL